MPTWNSWKDRPMADDTEAAANEPAPPVLFNAEGFAALDARVRRLERALSYVLADGADDE